MDRKDLSSLTLRQVAHLTREMPIIEGGLDNMIEKIILSIEGLEETVKILDRRICCLIDDIDRKPMKDSKGKSK